jgi:DNA-binding response OmpR family regulator
MTASPLVDHPVPEFGLGQRSGRVLVAEDDPEMRRLLASALRRDGFDVIEAADGKELLDRFSDAVVAGHPIDVVVTDVRMPKLSGMEAVRLIKAAAFETAIVVITAFGDQATHVDAWMLGAAEVMDKPFEIEELLRVIHRFRPEPE